METKRLVRRFFDENKDLCKEVKLTDEEIDLFEKFEWAILVNNGLKNIICGYSAITIYDIEEDIGDNGEDIEYILCEAECGAQDMGGGGSSRDKWQIKYNRKTKEFE